MAGGTPGNQYISRSIQPQTAGQQGPGGLRPVGQPAQPQGGLGGMTTDMGMGTGMGRVASVSPYNPNAPKTPTQQQGGWGNQYWGVNNQGGGGSSMPPIQQQTPPAYAPIQYNPYNPGTQSNAPLDMWAIASGRQQYGPQQQQRSPYEQPGGYGGGAPGQSPYPTGAQAGMGPVGAPIGPGMDIATWMGMNNDGGQRRSVYEYSQMMMPYYEMGQNAYQYGMDFNESQRRYDIQSQQQAQNDLAQQQIAWRQQGLSEEQVRIASEQWNQQFAHTRDNDYFNRGLSLNDQQLAWKAQGDQTALGWGQQATDRYGVDVGAATDRYRTDAQTGLGYYQTDAQTGLGYAQVGQDRYATDTGAATDRYRTDAQTGLGWGQVAADRYKTDAQTGLGYAQVGQDRYSTDTNAALMRQQMMQQFGIDTRGMDITQQNNLANQLLGRQELQQTGALARERMALDERTANMQNYGRAMAPGAKFIRNW